jgi:TonB family protein
VQPAVQRSQPASVLDLSKVVFRGLGDGGPDGGGGDRSTRPAARAQTRPADAIALAVASPPPRTPPDAIAPEPPPFDALAVPLTPMDAGLIRQLGTVDGPSGPPTNGRGPGDGSTSGPDGGSGLRAGPGGRFGVGGPGTGDGVRPPEILYKTSPQYTAESMRAKIQGVALLTGVVAPDGTLHDIRIARSLDGAFGLDQEAITCVRQWRFRPGTRLGEPVAVAVTIEVAFNLR